MPTMVMPERSECFSSLRPIECMLDHWWLCMTHGGKEKPLANKLAAARVDYFLPLTEYRDSYRKLKIRPLFPAYIFLNGDEAREVASYTVEKLVIYPVSNKTQSILTHELIQIAKALEVNPALGAEPHNFEKHERVRVVKGPMMGLEGQFDCNSSHGRVWLQIKILGQKGIPVEVPIEFCEPA